jgi:hypothetical protein
MVVVLENNVEDEGVTEWLKVADCKSVGISYVGSNPTSFKIKSGHSAAW